LHSDDIAGIATASSKRGNRACKNKRDLPRDPGEKFDQNCLLRLGV
jgi:hypothetical protein